MFGRKSSDGKDVLASRVRQLSETRPVNQFGAPGNTEGGAGASHPEPSVARTVHNKPRATRHPVFRTATLVTGGGGRQNVAIKDLSATGARIEFHTRGELPVTVMLIEPTLKLSKRARVVWQDEGIAGLQFLKD